MRQHGNNTHGNNAHGNNVDMTRGKYCQRKKKAVGIWTVRMLTKIDNRVTKTIAQV